MYKVAETIQQTNDFVWFDNYEVFANPNSFVVEDGNRPGDISVFSSEEEMNNFIRQMNNEEGCCMYRVKNSEEDWLLAQQVAETCKPDPIEEDTYDEYLEMEYRLSHIHTRK